MLAGVRAGRARTGSRPAPARRPTPPRTAPDRLSVFESMLIASGYNLLRRRAPATPAFAAQRAPVGAVPARRSRRSTTRASTRRSCPRTSTSSRPSPYFELARSGLRSDVPGAVLTAPGEARRRGAATSSTGSCPRGSARCAARVAGHRVTALSDRDRAAARLPRAHRRAAGARDRRRRPGRVARRPPGAPDRRPHDVGLPGARTATSPTSAAARASRGRSRSAPRRGPRRRGRAAATAGRARSAPSADRALGRLAALHPIGAGRDGDRAVRRRPGDVPAIDDYASEVVYNGLTLTALGWAAGRAPVRAAAPAASSRDRDGGARAAVRGRALRDAPRAAACGWRSSSASQAADGRAAFGLRALKYRARAAAAGSTSCPPRRGRRRPAGHASGRRCGCAPGALAQPAGTRDRGPPRPDRRARRLGRAAGAGCAGDVTFRFVADRARRAHRRAHPQGRPDRLLGAAPPAGRGRTAAASPSRRPGRARRAAARVALQRPVRVEQLARRLARGPRGPRARAARPLRGPRALATARLRRVGRRLLDAARAVRASPPRWRRTTMAIATTPAVARSWSRMRKPSSAAIAGSRLMITPNSAVGSRRSAISSNAYGSSGISSASPMPASSTSGASSSRAGARHADRQRDERRDEERDRQPFAARPSARRPAWSAGCRPPSTRPRRTRSATPAGSSGSPAPSPSVSSATPAPASATHATSRAWREPASATPSGPRNSIVTATPSGIRAIASKNASVSTPEQAPSATAAREVGARAPAQPRARERPQDQRGERQPQRDGARPGRCGRTAARTARRRAGSSSSTRPRARCPARGPRRGAGGSGRCPPHAG